MTKDERTYLECVAGLDAIQHGMLWPSTAVRDPERIRDRCAARGWIRLEDESHPCGELVVYLTTKGHKTLQRLRRDLEP